MTREDRSDIALKGLFLGLILFVSMIIELLASRDMQHMQIVGTFLVPIILGYCLVGMFIRWMFYRSTLKKEGFQLFSGFAIVYWIGMLSTVFIACAYLIPQVIRYIVLANAAALLVTWLLDYLYLKNIAKELNSGLGYHSRMLVEDLPSKPQTEDIFMEEIENYCQKYNLPLEIIEYGIPAKIKMNNTLYKVNLGQYYSLVGTVVYTLEFHNMVSNKETNIG